MGARIELHHSKWHTPLTLYVPTSPKTPDLSRDLAELDTDRDGVIRVSMDTDRSMGKTADGHTIDFTTDDSQGRQLAAILRGRGDRVRRLDEVRSRASGLSTEGRLRLLNQVADVEELLELVSAALDLGDPDTAALIWQTAMEHSNEWQSPNDNYFRLKERVEETRKSVVAALMKKFHDDWDRPRVRLGLTPGAPATVRASELLKGGTVEFRVDVPLALVPDSDPEKAAAIAGEALKHARVYLQENRPFPERPGRRHLLRFVSLEGPLTLEEFPTAPYLNRRLYEKYPAAFFRAKFRIDDPTLSNLEDRATHKFDVVYENGKVSQTYWGVVLVDAIPEHLKARAARGEPATFRFRVTSDEHVQFAAGGDRIREFDRALRDREGRYDHVLESPHHYPRFRPRSEVDSTLKFLRRHYAYTWRNWLGIIAETTAPDIAASVSAGDTIDAVNPHYDPDYHSWPETNYFIPHFAMRGLGTPFIGVEGNHHFHPQATDPFFRPGQGVPKKYLDMISPTYGSLGLIQEGGLGSLWPFFSLGIGFDDLITALRSLFYQKTKLPPGDDALMEGYRILYGERQSFTRVGPLTVVRINAGREDFRPARWWIKENPSFAEAFREASCYTAGQARMEGPDPQELPGIILGMIGTAMAAEEQGKKARMVVLSHGGFLHRKEASLFGIPLGTHWTGDTIYEGIRRVLVAAVWLVRNHVEVVLSGHTHGDEEYGLNLKFRNPADQAKFERELLELFTKLIPIRRGPEGIEVNPEAEEFLVDPEKLPRLVKELFDKYGVEEVPYDAVQAAGRECVGTISERLAAGESLEAIKRDVGPIVQFVTRSLNKQVPAWADLTFDAEGRLVRIDKEGFYEDNAGARRFVSGEDICRAPSGSGGNTIPGRITPFLP